jgi:type II secretory pathway component GspD/PulD (secretin)
MQVPKWLGAIVTICCVSLVALAAPASGWAQDMRIDNLPAGTQPAAGVASMRLAIESKYRLTRLNCRQFENALVESWLTVPQAEVIDGGNQIRVHFPDCPKTPSMVIDRQSQMLIFDGPENMADDWLAAVSAIDRQGLAADGSTVRIVGLNNLSPATVQQVAYLVSAPQEPAKPDDNITLPMPLNQQPGQGPPQIITREIDESQEGQGQTLSGNVTIQVFEELNLIVLTGRKEDVAIVEKAIRDIYKTAVVLQPKIERVPLANSEPAATASQVQQVYDAIYATNQGPASITPIQEPKGLLVIGREEAVKTIKDIIVQYDVQSTDKTVLFRSFPLKFISAADAKQGVDEYFGQASQSQLSSPPSPLPVVTFADYRSNQLVVKASQNYIDQVAELLRTLDVESVPEGSEKVIKVFKLRNTVAQDIAVVLQDALNGQQPNAGKGYNPNQQANQLGQQIQNVQTTPGRSTLASSALQLRTLDRDGNVVRSGILFDVRVSADNSSNSLVVTGPASSMNLIETVIVQLDQIPNADTQIKVFQILNGDAQTLLTMLQSLFASTTQAGGGQQFGQQGGATGLSQLPLQNASATDGQTLVNLRLAIDQRTNSIIVSGPVGDLSVVEDLLTRLDEDDLNLRKTVVYRLSNAPVLDVADAVNTWLDERQTLTTADPSYVSQIIQSRRQIIVTPEVVSNSLLVSATPQFIDEILGVIRALDRRPPIIKVKVLIAEVNLSMLEEFGIEIGVQDSLLFDRGLGTIGFPFNQAGIGNGTGAGSIATHELLAGQGLSNLGVGRINNNLGFGGLVLSAGNESISLLLRALKNKSCLRVLSNPTITTVENQQGRVQVGARAPYVTQVNQTNFGLSNSVTLQDIGIILQVTPRVSPDGMIVMFVDATKSELGAEADGVAIFVNNNGQSVRQPQILTTNAQTTIMARSGQTVAFAGLVQETKTKSERGTPILSDLPVIGPFFRFESDSARRTELLIIMTPYIVENENDLEAHNHEDMDRMHWCLSDVAEIYGSTNYDPPPHYSTPEIFYPDHDPSGLDPQTPEQPPMEPDFKSRNNSLDNK